MDDKSSPGNSIYVAICEPENPPNIDEKAYKGQVANDIIRGLRTRHVNFMLKLKSVQLGRLPERVAHPYRHGISASIREIHAPAEIKDILPRYRSSGGQPIFVSYRKAMNNTSGERALLHEVFKSATNAGCVVYDGFEHPWPVDDGGGPEVRARLWMAAAGIFLVGQRTDYNSTVGLSEAQKIEWGMLYAQGKPWVMVVPSGAENSMTEFMMPNQPHITYGNIDDPNVVRNVGGEIVERIQRWRPRVEEDPKTGHDR